MIYHGGRSDMSDHLQTKKHEADIKAAYSSMKFSSLFKESSVSENKFKCGAGEG
jgi:hypothetical protein